MPLAPVPSYDVKAYRPFCLKNFGVSFGLHVALVLVLAGITELAFTRPEVVVPIDLTIVPPWAEQTDDPDVDPNPPPEPQPEVKPEPKPPEPEPEEVEERKVEAVEQVVEKPKPKPKPKEKPKPLNLREKAKLVTTSVTPPAPTDLRDKATFVKPPPNMPRTGKGTANDKPCTSEEFLRLMNQGYRIAGKNQIATSEAQRCYSLIQQQILFEWNKENFKWFPGLEPLHVDLNIGPGGVVRGWKIIKGSGDAAVDQTARAALARLKSFRGLSAGFLEQLPKPFIIAMQPTAQ